MSMPNIEDIKPKIELKREDVVNLLLASVALEEVSMAHILNAEGEKIQYVLGEMKPKKMDDIDDVNDKVDKVLKDLIKKEILLEFKLENILELLKDKKDKCHHDDDDK